MANRINRNEQVCALDAVTASTTNFDRSNWGARGIHLVIDVTARTSTSTLTVTIQGKDPVSGKFYTILASTAISAVSTVVLKVYPGLTAAANLAANDVIPSEWRVVATVASAGAITATIAANYVA